MQNTNSIVQGLSSGRRAHFLQREQLHQIIIGYYFSEADGKKLLHYFK